MRRALVLLLAFFAFTAPLCAGASGEKSTYALSLLGKPSLPALFPYFPYVNPKAPKGGEIRLGAIGSFDSFNPYIIRGDPADGLERVWDTLLLPSANEVSTAYGLIAERIEILAGRSSVTFILRPQARFSDGTPITATDVAWTFDVLRRDGKPFYRVYYAGVKAVRVAGVRRVTFLFYRGINRELPLIIGEMPVLPEHFFKGRDFSAPLAVPPVGSGPYRIAQFAFGRSITYERVKNYWAKDLPVRIGTDNFALITYEYFRDESVMMEAFKAGAIDLREENIAKNWFTAYNFPAVKKGWVIRVRLRHHLPTGMQGFVMNTRRPEFADPRVREALSWAFDFEWMNRTLFFSAYQRTKSYFANSDLASSGLPEGGDLVLLDPYRKELPPALFTQPLRLPVTDGSGDNRPELLKALKLLEEAGWHVKDDQLVDAAGQSFRFTILLDEAAFERVALPYVQDLKRLGITVNVRLVDPATYQRLLNDFDFDMTVIVIPESESPGNEQADYWSCAASRTPGSDNLAGVCSKVVDALIRKIIAAPDRAALGTAVHALDRVLLWGWYVVPQWHYDYFNLAYWNKFSRPSVLIRNGFVLDTWWYDQAKAAALAKARGGD